MASSTFSPERLLRGERGVAIAMMAFTLVCFPALDSCAKYLWHDLPAM